LEEVAHHYEAVGGKSPLNEITLRQAEAVKKLLAKNQSPLPVYIGMRNAKPYFRNTLKRMAADGVERALGFILSSHRTDASWERYQKNIAQARAQLAGDAPAIDYCDGWHDHPLFIQTWVELINDVCDKLSSTQRDATPLLFTAHSLPVPMAAQSSYVAELQTSARLIGEKLRHHGWTLAYQSRSGQPGDPWLEPDISAAIGKLAAAGNKDVVVAPIGFVCDHVEVLYDLGIEAKKRANDLGVNLIRASCPNDHPTFVRMIADVINRKLRIVEGRG
jgi:ferrochelatase